MTVVICYFFCKLHVHSQKITFTLLSQSWSYAGEWWAASRFLTCVQCYDRSRVYCRESWWDGGWRDKVGSGILSLEASGYKRKEETHVSWTCDGVQAHQSQEIQKHALHPKFLHDFYLICLNFLLPSCLIPPQRSQPFPSKNHTAACLRVKPWA